MCEQDCKGYFWFNPPGVCLNNTCICPPGWSGEDDWLTYNNCQVNTLVSKNITFAFVILGAVQIILALFEWNRLVLPLLRPRSRELIQKAMPLHSRYFCILIPTTSVAITHLTTPLGYFIQNVVIILSDYQISRSIFLNFFTRLNFVVSMTSFCNGLWLQSHVYYQLLPPVFSTAITKKVNMSYINYILGFGHAIIFSVIMLVDLSYGSDNHNYTYSRQLVVDVSLAIIFVSISSCSILCVYLIHEVRSIYKNSQKSDTMVDTIMSYTSISRSYILTFALTGCAFLLGCIFVDAMKKQMYIFMNLNYIAGSVFQVVNMWFLRNAYLPGLGSRVSFVSIPNDHRKSIRNSISYIGTAIAGGERSPNTVKPPSSTVISGSGKGEKAKEHEGSEPVVIVHVK